MMAGMFGIMLVMAMKMMTMMMLLLMNNRTVMVMMLEFRRLLSVMTTNVHRHADGRDGAAVMIDTAVVKPSLQPEFWLA